jgi:hypothetical protein
MPERLVREVSRNRSTSHSDNPVTQDSKSPNFPAAKRPPINAPMEQPTMERIS